eukprot:m.105534 g.105534  ORF g.105534 m.105534 type:complete len:114 (-) comp15721_c0_seq1:50-391(-)
MCVAFVSKVGAVCPCGGGVVCVSVPAPVAYNRTMFACLVLCVLGDKDCCYGPSSGRSLKSVEVSAGIVHQLGDGANQTKELDTHTTLRLPRGCLSFSVVVLFCWLFPQHTTTL